MNNNLKPIDLIPPFKRFCMTIGELPSSYLESMTYYEMLVWFTKFLQDTVIPAINNNGEAVSELQTKYIELKNYVDTYFDNLDLQEEVNNKLDKMVEDGTLLNLLSNYTYLEKVYESFIDLYNDTTLIGNEKVKVLGYNEINDGDGGEYIINENEGILLSNGLYALPLSNYESNFYNEITFTQERNYNTDCYITEIPLNDNNNNQIDLYVAKRDYSGQTPIKYAQENLTSLTINATLSIKNQDDDSKSGIPTVIGNGEILNNNSMYGETGVADNYLYVGIKEDRSIEEFKVNNTTNEQLISAGCKNVFNCYYKLIEDYFPVDLTNVVTNEAGIVTGRHPRQVLCELENKKLMIFTCDGRTGESQGLTSAEMQTILIDKHVKNAWNLDGGGSTSTEIKTIKINRNIDSENTADRYIPYTLNAKKIIKNKNVAEIYSEISKMLQFMNKRYQEERIRTHNIAHQDLNNLIGELYFGFGTDLTNAPGSLTLGYFMNMTDNVTPENRLLYNKQIFYETTNGKFYTRQQVNGVWTSWQLTTNPISRIPVDNTTLATTGYNELTLRTITNYDTVSVINNNDNSFSLAEPGNKLLYVACRIGGSTGDKFIKLTKNGTDVSIQSNYNSDTQKHQIILIGQIEASATTDKFKLLINGTQGDSISQFRIYIK